MSYETRRARSATTRGTPDRLSVWPHPTGSSPDRRAIPDPPAAGRRWPRGCGEDAGSGGLPAAAPPGGQTPWGRGPPWRPPRPRSSTGNGAAPGGGGAREGGKEQGSEPRTEPGSLGSPPQQAGTGDEKGRDP